MALPAYSHVPVARSEVPWALGVGVIGGLVAGVVYSIWAAATAGMLVHMLLAMVYGIVFAVVLGGLRSAASDIMLGGTYGFALWIVNFYLIARRAFPWFLDASPVVQFIGHTFFFGVVLGWFVWRSRERITIGSP